MIIDDDDADNGHDDYDAVADIMTTTHGHMASGYDDDTGDDTDHKYDSFTAVTRKHIFHLDFRA